MNTVLPMNEICLQTEIHQVKNIKVEFKSPDKLSL